MPSPKKSSSEKQIPIMFTTHPRAATNNYNFNIVYVPTQSKRNQTLTKNHINNVLNYLVPENLLWQNRIALVMNERNQNMRKMQKKKTTNLKKTIRKKK